ncbi:cytidylyltransferase domain-containing protein [Roseivirga seohaensis]|uniref:acylneuraminate cytidylyltransferase family protein n=1 Tax=Roseivirga seohaensis TaxID=1914963 RepID=UPI003BA9E495
MVNKKIAIIPARGGSKRLPKKNILEFNGEPMISWTIKAAIEANLFDHVIVSTDSEEIAEISRSFGAEVPFLRTIAHDDISPVSEATISALQQMELVSGIQFQTVTQLMPNCPLRSSTSIIEQMNAFGHTGNCSVLSGFSYGMSNPWWAHKHYDDGSSAPLFESALKERSQDLPQLICPSGATWISSKVKLLKHRTFYSPNYRFFHLDWKEAIDIDDAQDLELALVASKL